MVGPAEPPEPSESLIRLLLDEMYPPGLAGRLRVGCDVIAVLDVEVGLASRTDEDVLAWAERNGRCVVTENMADFARLAQQGHGHAGIVLVSSRRFPRTASGLHRMATVLQALHASGGLPGRDGVTWLL